MDRTQLQQTLDAARSRLAADRDGELSRSGMPSDLAYLSLPLLEALAASDDPYEVGDLLRELVGTDHRKALGTALRDPLVALRSMAEGDALSQACAALVATLGGAAAVQAAEVVRLEMRAERIENAKQIVATNYYEAHDEARARAERALADYLRLMRHQCNTMQLARIDPREGRHQAEMRLERVYIGLNTERYVELRKEVQATVAVFKQAPGDKAVRAVSALEALSTGTAARLMLLGAPGSGKSTFVNHLALCLAGACIGERDATEKEQGDALMSRLTSYWTKGAMLPIRIVLRELAQFVAYAPVATTHRSNGILLQAFLQDTLTSIGCAEVLEPLLEALGKGEAILLFDGLDEVEAGPVLVRITECILAAAGVYTRSPVLVTCRVLDYQANEQRRLPGFQVETLAQLDDGQIEAFIDAWHAEVAVTGRTMLGDATGLRQALAGRADLKEMARQPLLLTMMAIVHAGKGKLPDARALLYSECVELLLLRWRSEPDAPDLLLQLGVPEFKEPDLIKVMARIAFAAHNRSLSDLEATERPADLGGVEVKAELDAAFTYYVADEERRAALVVRLLRAFATRNGLLLKQSGERGEVYAFPHRSFQEFLAGYWISLQGDFDRLVWERAGQVGWHEALRLMASYQALKEVPLGPTLQVIKELLDEGAALERTLAGELLALVGYARAAGYRAEWAGPHGRWARACATLRAVSTGNSTVASAPLRARAGMALGQLCYGSLEVLTQQGTTLLAPDPRLLDPATGDAPNGRYWCIIEPGRFWYGDYSQETETGDDGEDGEGASDSGEDANQRNVLRLVSLGYSFKIARYPVTNAEFAAFIAAGGYENEAWWTPEGWKYIHPGSYRFEGEPERIAVPRFWTDPDLNNPLQPVVGVSWYEATAYCLWLTARGHAEGWLPPADEIRLPTSLEWERAARHTDKRRYPWGDDEPSPERANYTDTAIEYTSPVGCFPAGAAVCGAEDMIGNMREWMATPYDVADQPAAERDFTPDKGVLTSYSDWGDPSENLFCGSRGWLDPFSRDYIQGFRVIWSRALSG